MQEYGYLAAFNSLYQCRVLGRALVITTYAPSSESARRKIGDKLGLHGRVLPATPVQAEARVHIR